jgi:hypothetical protein
MKQEWGEHDEVAVCTIRGNLGQLLLLADEDWNVMAFETRARGLGYFEDSFRRHNRRDRGVSAVLFCGAFEPRVHLTTLAKLRELVGQSPHCYNVRNMSASMRGIALGPKGQEFHATGEAPVALA